jgi:acetyl esterase/lipase
MTGRFLVAILCWMGAATLAATAAPRGNRMADDSVEIAYGPDPAQMLDLYRAGGPGPHRLVLFVHGGGWVAGNQHPGGRRLAATLNRAGYTLASVGYRLVPHTDVAGSVSDVARAAAFLLRDAASYGIDPAHFALMGHSSGAHLVALLGTDQSYLRNAGVDPAKLETVITLDGVFDVPANITHYPTETRKEVFGADPAVWTRYSPVSHLDGMQSHPEFCLMHEDTNPRFVEQEQLFETALRQHGEKVEAATAPGLKHAELMKLFDSNEPMAMFTLNCLAKS